MTIYDLTPCATCTHAAAIHMPGSVCGAAHCYCREFVLAHYDDVSERDGDARPREGNAEKSSCSLTSPDFEPTDRELGSQLGREGGVGYALGTEPMHENDWRL